MRIATVANLLLGPVLTPVSTANHLCTTLCCNVKRLFAFSAEKLNLQQVTNGLTKLQQQQAEHLHGTTNAITLPAAMEYATTIHLCSVPIGIHSMLIKSCMYTTQRSRPHVSRKWALQLEQVPAGSHATLQAATMA